MSRPLILRSVSAFWKPAYAASLKDWSPLPPMSYARPMPLVLAEPPLEAEVDEPPQAERATARDAVATPATAIRDTRRMNVTPLCRRPNQALIPPQRNARRHSREPTSPECYPTVLNPRRTISEHLGRTWGFHSAKAPGPRARCPRGVDTPSTRHRRMRGHVPDHGTLRDSGQI